MKAVIKLVLLSALRDRLFAGLGLFIVAAFGVALFLGDAAIAEQREAGIAFTTSSARVIVVFGLIVFIAFQTQRLFDSKEIEAILSRALSRSRFVLSYWIGFLGVTLLLSATVSLLVLYLYGLSLETAAWCLSLLLECLLVVAFAQFAGLTLERATTTIFVTAAFYMLARLMGFFLGIRDATPSAGPNKIINPMIDALALAVPRIDLMTQSDWIIYGFSAAPYTPMVLTQAVVFIGVLLAASAFDLQRKQF